MRLQVLPAKAVNLKETLVIWGNFGALVAFI